MRSHISKSALYLVILLGSLAVSSLTLQNSSLEIQFSAILPFNDQPLFIDHGLAVSSETDVLLTESC